MVRGSLTKYEWNQRVCVGDLSDTMYIMGTLSNFV